MGGRGRDGGGGGGFFSPLRAPPLLAFLPLLPFLPYFESVRRIAGVPLPLDGVLGKRAAGLGERVRPFGGVDVAVGIDRHTLPRRALIDPVVAFEWRDECGDAVFVDRADPHTV